MLDCKLTQRWNKTGPKMRWINDVAGALEISERQAANLIGSGKVYIPIGRVPDWEINRLIAWRRECPEWYLIWNGENVRFLNSAKASHLGRVSQELIVDMVHRGDIAGQKMGNTIQVDAEDFLRWWPSSRPYLTPPYFGQGYPASQSLPVGAAPQPAHRR